MTHCGLSVPQRSDVGRYERIACTPRDCVSWNEIGVSSTTNDCGVKSRRVILRTIETDNLVHSALADASSRTIGPSHVHRPSSLCAVPLLYFGHYPRTGLLGGNASPSTAHRYASYVVLQPSGRAQNIFAKITTAILSRPASQERATEQSK